MWQANRHTEIQKIEVTFRGKKYAFRIQRDDLIDPYVSGNKLRKLLGWEHLMAWQTADSIITFGGAYSNHLVATAAFFKDRTKPVIGIVRGNEGFDNHYLQKCREFGMRLYFISREDYRRKYAWIQEQLSDISKFPFIIPEGGRGFRGTNGFHSVVDSWRDFEPETVVHASATGTTLAGFAYFRKYKNLNFNIEAVLVLKNLEEQISNVVDIINNNDEGGGRSIEGLVEYERKNLERMQDRYYEFEQENRKVFVDQEWKRWFSKFTYLNDQFIFGGYAKTTPELLELIHSARKETGIIFDQVYTGKALYAMLLAFEEGRINPETTLFYHTGGQMGVETLNPSN